MNAQVIIQDNNTGVIYDASNLTKNIKWETEVSNQPGKLTLSLVDIIDLRIGEGSIISVKINDQNVFFGYAFNFTKSGKNELKIIAYDQMRYLKNKDTYQFSNMTASRIFQKICKDFNLQYTIKNNASYALPKRLYDNKSLFDIIDWSITETLAATGEWYMIRDNFGTLEFNNLNNLKTNLFIGDESLLTQYDYESSIDSDSYNQVKLIQENKTTGKREIYIVNDSSNISKWGTLQYFEKMDEDANEAQITERAKQILQLKNRVTKSLKIKCLGDLRVFAGAGVIVGIASLSAEGLSEPRYFVVTKCTHTFENMLHTMDLELQVSV